jgi:hypothetical protein
MANILYVISAASRHDSNASLIDRGSNGGIAGATSESTETSLGQKI